MDARGPLAVVGVSQDPAKYGHKIFKTLAAKGFDVYAVNPKGGETLGRKIYPSLEDLPQKPQTVIMVIPPASLPDAVRACIKNGVRQIWFQPGAQSPEAFTLAQSAGILAVESCFMMDNGLW